ncbi:SpoIIE family protein phosphatase [Natranaerofaba carboxydovora]|uniref:SpoIIE family protein phosphatase n=1 Tax=Natranaerofaba carboxydovora TaxID=2742683 RepID=UPI001F130163|nr:PAS domain S-box protein [Natranaerofaba carboxydovora]UMZ74170.1 Sensor protein FixL [Natranaerofaba carboxydovora]
MVFSKDQYRRLLELLPEGFFYSRMVYDEDNKPIDYIFLKVNYAFEILTDLSSEEVIDKRAKEIFPDIDGSWIEQFAAVADSGGYVNFESYFAPLDKWYYVTVFGDKPGYFACIFYDISDEVEMKRKLIEKEQMYKALAENSPDIIMRFDREIRHIYVNKATEELTGIPCSEFIGKTHYELGFAREMSEYWESKIKSVFKTGEPKYDRFEYEGINGYKKVFDWRLIPEFDEKVEVSSVLSTARDITEVEKSREALKDREAQMARAQKMAKLGSWELDIKTNKLRWCKRTYQIFEINDKTPITYEYFLSLVHPDDRDYVSKEWLKAAKGFKEYNIEHRIYTKNGIKWVRELAEIEYDYKNRPTKAYGAVQDITEQKRVQEELEKSEEKFRNFIENANDIIFAIDHKGYFTYISPNCYEYLGYKLPEIINRDFMSFVHPDDREKIKKSLDSRIYEYREKDGQNVSYISIEYRLKHKSGEWRWVDVKTSILEEKQGKFELMGIARDVTEQRVMEEELDNYYIELETLYERLDKEINKAKEMHEKALPVIFPEVDNLSVSAFYQPAEMIGGDFYNVVKKDNQVVLYISDVTGHGLDSAMMSSFIKNTIDTYISLCEGEISPGRILEFVTDRYLNEGYPDDFFICIYIVVFDQKNYELKYTGAGFHEPPIVDFGDGKEYFLNNVGLPISSAVPKDMLNFQSLRRDLAPGSTVLISSDGLSEQVVDGKYYGNRLKNVFYKYSNCPPELIIEAIKNDYVNFNNGILQGDDDITLVVFQVYRQNKMSFSYELRSELEELNWLDKDVQSKLPPVEESQYFLMALHELTANAIEHGNQLNKEKNVRVDIIYVEQKYLMAVIEDEGEGFDWQQKLRKEIELSGEKERGRGVLMSAMISDIIYYNHKGNKVIALIKIE